MRGTHTGYSFYGEPTGKRINVLGVSHHLIQNGRIQREWTLFDEFALLKQLYRPA
jgi:predicted ester cyclase